MRFADCRKLKIFHSPLKDLNALHNPPAPAHLRWAIRAPCLCLRPASHARGCFGVGTHAELLFSRAGRNPVFCSLRPSKSPRLRRAHLRWAIRARAVPAQGCLCRRARHPRCGLWCVGRPQSGAPCWFLGPPLHARGLFRVRARAGLLFPGAQTGSLFPQARGWFVFVLGSATRPFFYSIKQAQACKAMRSLQVVQLFCLHKFYIPCSISCGVWKRAVLPQWFSTFSTEFSTTPHRVLHRVPPSIFENYVNLQQYNAYKREERGKALFFVNSF